MVRNERLQGFLRGRDEVEEISMYDMSSPSYKIQQRSSISLSVRARSKQHRMYNGAIGFSSGQRHAYIGRYCRSAQMIITFSLPGIGDGELISKYIDCIVLRRAFVASDRRV